MDANNLVAALDEISLLRFFNDQLQDVVCSDKGRDLEAGDTTHSLELSNDLIVNAASKNWDRRTILGDQASNVAGVRHDDD